MRARQRSHEARSRFLWIATACRVSRLPRGGLTAYMQDMCGRVIQASPPDQLGLKIIDALDPRERQIEMDGGADIFVHARRAGSGTLMLPGMRKGGTR